MTLGRLSSVDLRHIWRLEAQDFTPWLAREENLALLSETLALDLELEAVERPVGVFKADILCKDTVSDRWVLIENQLERTDHSHLGQLLTYAAGLDAVTIVWVAAKVADEHRAALDWLNEITASEVRFFALEVELWRIGDSAPAPKFNVVCQPNDWSRQASAAKKAVDADVTPLKEQYLRYWSAFGAQLTGSGSVVRAVAGRAKHWLDHSIGRSGFILRNSLNSQEGWIRAELYLNAKVAGGYPLLLAERDRLEAAYGASLDWQELPGRGASRICDLLRADPTDEADWPRQHEWLIRSMTTLYRAFQEPVRALPRDLTEEEPDT